MASTEVTNAGKPLQTIPFSKKTKEWYKENGEFLIQRCNFVFGAQPNERKDLRVFYDVYNSQFPLSWFKHITDPLSAKVPAHKAFPAKIRPVTILRTNIDLLLGEYPRRPFIYNVENLGEDGYISYTEGLKSAIRSNLDQHFVLGALEQAQAMGQELTPEELEALQADPPTPNEIKEKYHATYKDALAIKGQKWLRRQVREQEMRRKLLKMFKDYLIAGQCYSYKGVENEQMVYRRISPLNIDYDKSPDVDFIEDGEWVVARYLWVLSDVVDKFYSKLSEKQQKELENEYNFSSPQGFYDRLKGLYTDPEERNKIPVFHAQWKGRKKIGFLTYFDEEVMAFVTKEVDESYVVDREAGEVVEWKWINTVHEVWRVGSDMYIDYGEIAVQRNEMNNISSCKLEYNGRKYSDTHSENISVLEMGLPFQIMYIIVTYTLEKTIAKSKGKILLIDQNAIPDDGDWDDEKFFYYSEALGYGLLNRNQIGVDKSWNQYQVIDMSLFDQISQLIELQMHFKQEWDDIIGISRQRKGQTYASDGVGSNERAVFQSTVITDMIYIGFEEFQERELQGIMDYCKFLTSKGVKGIYNDDDFSTQLMDIEPEDFANASMGVFVDGASEHMRKLQEMRSYAQALVQNNAKPSTVLEVIDSVNIADLKTKLKRIEEIENQIAQSQAQSEQEMAQLQEEIVQRHESYRELLKRQTMEAEYDRKEDIEHIKGTYNIYSFQKAGVEAESAEVGAAQDMIEGQQKIVADQMNKNTEHSLKKSEQAVKRAEVEKKIEKMEHDMKMDEEDLKLKKGNQKLAERKLKIDARKASPKKS